MKRRESCTGAPAVFPKGRHDGRPLPLSDPARSAAAERRVAIVTLGCKINQYDSNSLAAAVELNGHRVVPDPAAADVILVNTCTVTGKTDYKGRQLIRKVIERNPSAVVVVTGCYAQVQPEPIAAIPGVDYVFGNSEKARIGAWLSTCVKRAQAEIRVGDIPPKLAPEEEPPEVHSGTTRAFLKIQDGCDERCAYCIVPRARGRSRSLPVQGVLEKMSHLGRGGYQEVVLCGIHLGVYGRDLDPPVSLAQLLARLDEDAVVPRIRVSSIEPNEIDAALIELFAEARSLCPHFHLPMQSGDRAVLETMGRKYGPEDFARLVEALLLRIPQAAIGVDVIAGFPGESEPAYRNSLELLRSLPVSYFHVFPYSARPGTPAASMPDPVRSEVIQRRAEELRRLGHEKRAGFYRRFLGKDLEVLVESRRDRETRLLRGFSRNYVPLFFDGEDAWQRRRVIVRAEEVRGTRVYGAAVAATG
ncbi:MAG: tRNA (N(6)-L-threonylcarbamoyladenosine(37)-C(2))-methylthiotransferase MtaB [bacterium]